MFLVCYVIVCSSSQCGGVCALVCVRARVFKACICVFVCVCVCVCMCACICSHMCEHACVVCGTAKWRYCMVYYVDPMNKSSAFFVANDRCATTLN